MPLRKPIMHSAMSSWIRRSSRWSAQYLRTSAAIIPSPAPGSSGAQTIASCASACPPVIEPSCGSLPDWRPNTPGQGKTGGALGDPSSLLIGSSLVRSQVLPGAALGAGVDAGRGVRPRSCRPRCRRTDGCPTPMRGIGWTRGSGRTRPSLAPPAPATVRSSRRVEQLGILGQARGLDPPFLCHRDHPHGHRRRRPDSWRTWHRLARPGARLFTRPTDPSARSTVAANRGDLPRPSRGPGACSRAAVDWCGVIC